jgi:predicted phage terminase large subunit-like protein
VTVTEGRWQPYDHLRHLNRKLVDVAAGRIKRLMVFMPPRHGKLLADETPVPTVEGWKKHGDLQVGDRVFGSDGHPCNVVATSPKSIANVEVELTNGQKYCCHENHEWLIYDRGCGQFKLVETLWFLRDTKFGVKLKLKSNGRYTYQMPLTKGLYFPEKSLSLHPYVLGAWLGDGSCGKACITHASKENEVIEKIKRLGYSVSTVCCHKETKVLTTYFSGQPPYGGKMTRELKDLGVYKNKHIPNIYKHASYKQRLDLIAGLIDTDGHVEESTGRVRIVTASNRLAKDIEEVAETLGFRPYITYQEPCISSSGIEGKNRVYTVGFQPTVSVPTILDRKTIKRHAPQRRIGIKNVKRLKAGKIGKCVQVDSPDGLYMVGEKLTVTHNSTITSQYFPAWYIGTFPHNRIILASYEADFASSWGRKARDILEEHGPNLFGVKVSAASSAANRWDLEGFEGGMNTAGVRGPITGKGGSVLIIDDPVKNDQEAMSPTYQESTWDWYLATFSTRVQNDGAIIIIMTRWNENDLAGKLLEAEATGGDKWEIVNLPALAEDADPLGRQPGDPLCSELFTKETLEKTKIRLGTFWWNSLYMQKPSPTEGGIFKRWWWKFWQPYGTDLPPVTLKGKNNELITVNPETLPARLDETAQSWDMAFKDTQSSSYVVGQVWGRKEANKYLLDQDRERRDFVSTISAVEAMTNKWPNARAKWVEDKANGPAVINTLKSKVSGLIPVTPEGSKEARAYAVSPEVESGNVYLPHPAIAPWVWDYIDELTSFPNAANDDQVDSTTQALLKMSGRRQGPRLVPKPAGM